MKFKKFSRRNPGEYKFLKIQKLNDRKKTLMKRKARFEKYVRRVI